MNNEWSPGVRKKLFDGSDYQFFVDDRENPIQPAMELYEKDEAMELKMAIPKEWAEHIDKIAKKLKIQPEFLYRKAIQAFFGLPPSIFSNDGYLCQWKEVFALDGEHALREHIQNEDDSLTKKIIRERNKNLK